MVYCLPSSYSSSIRVREDNGSTEKMLKHIFIKFKYSTLALGEEGNILTVQGPWSQSHRRGDVPLGGNPFGKGHALNNSLV